MRFNSKNSFKSLDSISSSAKEYKIFNLKKAEKNGLEGISKLPIGYIHMIVIQNIVKLYHL